MIIEIEDRFDKVAKLFSALLNKVQRAAQRGDAVHDVEEVTWRGLIETGREVVVAYIKEQTEELPRPELIEHAGKTLQRLPKQRTRPYVSAFGPTPCQRDVYATRETQRQEVVPLDAKLGMPESDTSYLLQGLLAHTQGMLKFLSHIHVLLKDFKTYAQGITERVRAATERLAKDHGRPLVYLDSPKVSKEETARQIAQRDGIREGLICVFSAVESCFSYEIRRDAARRRLELRGRPQKCLHYYFYLQHPQFGFMHLRLQTWFPLSIHIAMNGREWLARQLDAAGIGYRQADNCFLELQGRAASQRRATRQACGVNYTRRPSTSPKSPPQSKNFGLIIKGESQAKKARELSVWLSGPIGRQVFISYSHKDKKWFHDLRTHLKPHLHDGSMTAWSDEQIAPGTEWFLAIQTSIARTSVAVLLVTPNFLASDFIHKHELAPILKEAKGGGVQIVWIPDRACAFETTPLIHYQAAIPPETPLASMADADRDEAWVKICQEITNAANRQ